MAQILTIRALYTFRRDFKKLPSHIQERAQKTLDLLRTNPRHPSLQVKKMKGPGEIWEARVTLSYRITFEWQQELILLRRIGTHDILNKESS